MEMVFNIYVGRWIVMSLTRLGPAMQSSIYKIGIIITFSVVNNNHHHHHHHHPFLSKQAHKDFINIEKGGTWLEVALLRNKTWWGTFALKKVRKSDRCWMLKHFLGSVVNLGYCRNGGFSCVFVPLGWFPARSLRNQLGVSHKLCLSK